MSDVKSIVENLEQSVLVLGPGIMLDEEGKSIHSGFAERYSKSNKGKIEYYFVHENLFRPNSPSARMRIRKDFADFYHYEFPIKVDDLYRKMSQIPFPLIISLNPDNTLSGCFRDLGITNVFDFFIKGKKNKINKVPSIDNPYLFNLLGNYTEPESLILTYDDLFEYLRNILHLLTWVPDSWRG